MNIGMDSPIGIPTVGFGKKTRNLAPGPEASLPFSPLVLGIGLVVIIVFIAFFATLAGMNGKPGEVGTPESSGLVGLDILLWGCLVFLVLVNGMAYLFNIDVTASLRGLFTSQPTIDLEVTGAPVSKVKPAIDSKQVFHVSDNKYTFKDAKAICSAYGGRLATVRELQSAYKKGADWCGYGWSEGQMALYPTQYEKWEKLQDIDGHEHDCGRPGINGGYIDNPKVQFGANCYGRKPDPTKHELRQMRNSTLYPVTAAEQRFDRLVESWRRKLSELSLSPFNSSSWFAS
tara:strand:- start:16340 stop:17203 length:864 start_codon:yes stop_codon:yes gene_type:complete